MLAVRFRILKTPDLSPTEELQRRWNSSWKALAPACSDPKALQSSMEKIGATFPAHRAS